MKASADVQQRREKLVDAWRQNEKRSERIGGVILIFGSALALSLQSSGDNIAALVAALGIAAGFTLIYRSRRPAEQRRHMYFVTVRDQLQRGFGFAVGGMLALWQSNGQPVLLIGGFLALAIAGWYGWRAQQLQTYEALFTDSPRSDEVESSER